MTCKAITPLVSRYSSAFIQPTTTFADIKSFADYAALQRDPLAKYNEAQVLNITSKLQAFSKVINPQVYPTLHDRVSQMVLNPYEIADFLDQTQYDPTELEATLQEAFEKTQFSLNVLNVGAYPELTADVKGCMQQLDFYYNNNVANTVGGGICGAIGNAFAQLTGLISLASAFAKKVSELANGAFSLIATLQGIKEKIMSVIDNLKENLKKQVENIANQIKGFAQNVFNTLNNKIQALKEFFTDFNLESLKETVEGFIAKAAGAFEELTLKNIAFLLFRFCQLTDLVQSFLQNPVKAMTEELGRYALFESIINGNSLQATVDAVRAGAMRLDPQERSRRRQELIDRINSRDPDRRRSRSGSGTGSVPRTSSFVTPPTTDEEKEWLQSITDSGASGYFTFNGGVTDMSTRAIERYESGASSPNRSLFDRSHHYPGAGWKEVVRINSYTFIGLKRVIDMMRERYGSSEIGTLGINSAYRSPYYNDIVDGAGSSIHMSAGALDISTPWEREVRGFFVKFASQQGFNGIGAYSTFIHIDLGDRRSWIAGWKWNGSEWVPKKSKFPVPAGDVDFWSTTLARHVSNSYRNSVEVPPVETGAVETPPTTEAATIDDNSSEYVDTPADKAILNDVSAGKYNVGDTVYIRGDTYTVTQPTGDGYVLI